MTFHITRAVDWREASKAPITKAEVDRLTMNDPDLAWSTTDYVDVQDEAGVDTRHWMITLNGRSSLVWLGGQLECSAPHDSQLAKLRDIARALTAVVVDDDGERHDSGDAPSREPLPPVGERWRGWLARCLHRRHRKTSETPLQFGIGDHVRDSWGHEHTVLAIDRAAEHGLGIIRTRRSDGTEHCRAVVPHGFVRIVKLALDDQADLVCPTCGGTLTAGPPDPTGWRVRIHGGSERGDASAQEGIKALVIEAYAEYERTNAASEVA